LEFYCFDFDSPNRAAAAVVAAFDFVSAGEEVAADAYCVFE